MKVLVTGCAGFVGSALACRLLTAGNGVQVVGVDNMNAYYDVGLKRYRLGLVRQAAGANSAGEWTFLEGDIADRDFVNGLFQDHPFDIVVNLAAQAGIRYSLENPDSYISSNIIGFYNILEACRSGYSGGRGGVKHLVFASSSSVYGGNVKSPFSENDRTDRPVSLYAATKKSDELMAYTYSGLYGIPCTGLRLFTVYGPAGRPDMAYYSFADSLAAGRKIRLFNYGNCRRDFTYIDDIVEALFRVMFRAPVGSSGEGCTDNPRFRIYNVGNSSPVNLLDFVRVLSGELTGAGVLPPDFDLQQHLEFAPLQPGEVLSTCADTSSLERDFGFRPSTDLRDGLRRFARWYRTYRDRK